MKVGVIGGGIAGLTAAHALAQAGNTVTVFDKGRGPGGRASSRRATLQDGSPDGTHVRFDHGAQYFTARDERFVRLVEEWMDAGIVAPWDAHLVSIERDSEGNRQVIQKLAGPTRYVGVPSMSRIVRELSEGLHDNATAHYGARVGELHRACTHWTVTDDAGESLGAFDAVVLAVPAPQAADLLVDLPDFVESCRAAEMRPNWALMLAFDAPLETGFDAAFINRQSERFDGRLSWIARDSSKPGRADAETWVVHADHRWTTRNIERAPDDIIAELLPAFFDAAGVSPVDPSFAQAHRWRFALPAAPLGDGCLFDRGVQLGVCGDWVHGARIEGAFLSGLSVAERLVHAHTAHTTHA
jgi:renalase